MKRILSFFLTLVLTAALLCPAALAVNETAVKDRDWVYITLDPGHGGDGAGGNDSGAVNEKYGYQEADLVLKIGLYLKEELETYRNVHVDMTRSDSYGTRYTPLREVKQRVDFAAEQCSDLLVSLHLNSAGSNQSVHGGLILASNGNYDPDCAKVIDAVGKNILAQLSRLGIDTSRGLVKEGSHDGTRYPNGKLADYYGIVRYGQLRHIPAMIVEHCFVSSNSDCEQFLSSDAKLRAIAQADARGIAAYYGLEKKDPGEVDVEPLFRDCRSHWAKDYVNRAADAGWVNGVGGGLFQPDGTLTRAMFVTMLAGLSGVDEADYPGSTFSDVSVGQWYAPSVAWAASGGIVSGTGDGRFEPNRNITPRRWRRSWSATSPGRAWTRTRPPIPRPTTFPTVPTSPPGRSTVSVSAMKRGCCPAATTALLRWTMPRARRRASCCAGSMTSCARPKVDFLRFRGIIRSTYCRNGGIHHYE